MASKKRTENTLAGARDDSFANTGDATIQLLATEVAIASYAKLPNGCLNIVLIP
jgi:hypothetical protein